MTAETNSHARIAKHPSASPAIIVVAALLDATLVTVFAAAGRAEHGSGHPLLGVFATAWPFLVALAIVWVVALVWRAPAAPVRSGLAVWLGTVALGMVLRVLFTDGGAAFAFILVATAFLGLTLMGWRLLYTGIARARARKQ